MPRVFTFMTSHRLSTKQKEILSKLSSPDMYVCSAELGDFPVFRKLAERGILRITDDFTRDSMEAGPFIAAKIASMDIYNALVSRDVITPGVITLTVKDPQ